MASRGVEVPAFVQESYRASALESMIVEQLLSEKVKKANIVITDQEVMAQMIESGAQQQPPLSLEDIKALIEAQGQTLEQAKQNVKQGLSYKKVMDAQLESQMNITEEDTIKFYNDNKKSYQTPEKVRSVASSDIISFTILLPAQSSMRNLISPLAIPVFFNLNDTETIVKSSSVAAIGKLWPAPSKPSTPVRPTVLSFIRLDTSVSSGTATPLATSDTKSSTVFWDEKSWL